jgi:hypothetical protein
MTRYVGKYLYWLNPRRVEEGALLDPSHVVPYLESVQQGGIGSCGVLHRLLAHKAVIQCMRMTVSTFVWF